MVFGFNPSEEYARQIGSCPQQIGVKMQTNENHHLEQLLLGFAFHGMCFFQHFDLSKVFFNGFLFNGPDATEDAHSSLLAGHALKYFPGMLR